MDRFVVHLPRWLRWSLLAGLVLLVVVFSTLFVVGSTSPSYSDWLPAAVSVVQIALTALAYVLVVFFTESGRNPRSLEKRATQMLTELLPTTLARITDLSGESMHVSVGAPSGIIGHDYHLRSSSTALRVWVGLNVHRAIIILFCEPTEEAHSDNAMCRQLQDIFKDTLKGAIAVGYDDPHIQPEMINGHRLVSIWLTWNIKQASGASEEDFLTNSPSRLFFVQDVAMMVQSFLRTAQRHNLNLATPVTPMPL